MAKINFPEYFLWGASTAAHQVEGGNHNQWSEWEQANAARLASTAAERYGHLPSWLAIKSQATLPENYISGKAVDHYNRYEEDFDILQELGMNAFRFSIEWSRIEPEEGQWDQAAIEHYRRYIHALKKRHIEPVLTLWHWTVPIWFAEKGGFERRDNIQYFERFVAKVATELLTDVRYILTLNEANNYTLLGYVDSKWPPLKRNVWVGLHVYLNLLEAHKRAYRIIKQQRPDSMVGLAPSLAAFLPLDQKNVFDRISASILAYAANWWQLDRTRRYQDFIGVNFYFTNYVNWHGAIKNPPKPLNDLGWYMEPKALGILLNTMWRRYHKPIIITENGLADARDKHRRWWLEQTLQTLQQTLARGVDIRGYLHWSLLDNFEWADGWWPNFGLVAVDRQTMRRTIRPSARWLASYIRGRTGSQKQAS